MQDHDYPSLRLSDLAGIQVPLPPIPKQKRIVAILDQAFADIDRAREITERNLHNIRELFESKKLELFDNLGESSSSAFLPQVCKEVFAGGDVPKDKLSKYKTEEYPVPIYANGEKNKGLYGYTDKARVVEPSITVSARGTIGYSEVRSEPFLPVVRLIVLIPNSELIELEYLNYVLGSMNFVNSGTSIPQLTVPMIKQCSIPVPSLDVQNKIVVELEELDTSTRQILSIYEKKILLLDKLKKSLLQKAFSGELTGDQSGAAA